MDENDKGAIKHVDLLCEIRATSTRSWIKSCCSGWLLATAESEYLSWLLIPNVAKHLNQRCWFHVIKTYTCHFVSKCSLILPTTYMQRNILYWHMTNSDT